MAKELNDLFDYGLKIYQDKDSFKFSLDSLLLYEFIKVRKGSKNLLDLCTGNAPIPMLIAKNTNLFASGIELQQKIYELACESIKYNNLEDKIKLYNFNANEAPMKLKGMKFDIISCNPPFFKVDKSSLINSDYSKALARHELEINLEEIFVIVDSLLSPNGYFYLVHRPERLSEILVNADSHHLKVKEINFIYTNLSNNAIMVLLEFKNHGENGCKVKSTIINRDTKTYQNIFERR